MYDGKDYVELVRQAQLGSRESVEVLSERVRGRLYAYVYRIVVDRDFAQDVVQESMLEMVKALGKLENAERFWPWLRTIAFNKIRRTHSARKGHRMPRMSDEPEARGGGADGGLAKLVADELRQAVVAAMEELKAEHRRVLTMRCYEEMEYSEIAELIGCSELGARVRFCRAKRALRRQLSRRGFGRGILVTALVLFGKLTAPSKSAAAGICVTSGTMKAGVTAGLAALAGGKTAVVLATAGVVAAGAAMVASGTGGTKAGRAGEVAGSLWTQAARGAEERWYYYPLGANGPVMMRAVLWDSEGEESYCQFWQDGEANYCFDKRKNTIYINNWRIWDRELGVERLPTDEVNMRDFVSLVTGQIGDMEYVSNDESGLLVIVRGAEEGGKRTRVVRHHNMLNEEYFRYKWPADAKVVDGRDAMHKRGWTYFRVSGRIDGKDVRGRGRIPFVYAVNRERYPWLELEVGDEVKIVDGGTEAVVYDGGGRVLGRYEGGSFFAGLGRPWMGLHTVDTVRRDAARQRVWFETKYGAGQGKAEVALTCEGVKLVYSIDLERDVVEKITFLGDSGGGQAPRAPYGDVKGEMGFSYLEEVEQDDGEFAAPARAGSGSAPRERLGMLWLVRLADSDW